MEQSRVSRESKILIGILAAVVILMTGVFWLANRSDNSAAPVGDKTKVTRPASHKEGSGSVQLVEFGDYQCPACGAAYPNVKQIMDQYNGRVTLYFRNFPLYQVHPNAEAGAEAAEAAADQGKFWEMHDLLYEKQKDWSDEADPTAKFVDYAQALGLDTTKFKQSLSDKKFKPVIDQDAADGTALNINATPTFFINGTQMTGGFDYANLRDNIDKALKDAGASPGASAPASPSASASPAQ